MQRLVRPGGVGSRWLRGAAFLWTVVVTVPVMFFAIGLGVDLTRIIMADREVSTAVHAAALSGAYQFNLGKVTLNAGRAKSAAQETMCVTQKNGGLSKSSAATRGRVGCSGGEPVSAAVVLKGSQTVRVTSTYRVEGLVMLKWFGVSNEDRSVWREATVCDPRESSGPTSGFCARPGL